MRRCRIFFAFLLLLFGSFCSCAQASKKIDLLTQRVSESRSTLADARQRWESAQLVLQQVEKRLAKAAASLAKTNDKIHKNRRQIRQKEQQLQANKRKLKQQIAWLNQSLRALAMWLNQPRLKWVLSSSDPSDWGRLTTYHRLIGEQQQQRVAELEQIQQAILEEEAALEKIKASLSLEQIAKKSHLLTLRHLEEERKQLLSRLQLSVKEKSRRLQQSKQALSAKIGLLQSDASIANTDFTSVGTDLASLRGQLRSPVKGRLQRLFGHTIADSELKWQGVLFDAPQDSPVRAVSDGRIVYAGWMAGYGWLTIIEHPKGYMTLYGRNHYLYKSEGESVRAGEVIARSGKSGGFKQSALYFAIRYKASALDPAKWLKS